MSNYYSDIPDSPSTGVLRCYDSKSQSAGITKSPSPESSILKSGTSLANESLRRISEAITSVEVKTKPVQDVNK